jgi:hypothetical protein
VTAASGLGINVVWCETLGYGGTVWARSDIQGRRDDTLKGLSSIPPLFPKAPGNE